MVTPRAEARAGAALARAGTALARASLASSGRRAEANSVLAHSGIAARSLSILKARIDPLEARALHLPDRA